MMLLPRSITIAVLVAAWKLVSLAAARRHHLFVGNLRPPATIRSLVFDDESLQLSVSRNLTADSSHSWITFNACISRTASYAHDMTRVHGTSLDVPRIATYDVVNNSVLQLATAIPAKGRCFNRTAAFVLASKRFPHLVFSASWPGPAACGLSAYPNPAGELVDVGQTWWYSSRSGIHGMALGWGGGQTLYSADLTDDAIWTHAFGFYGETYFLGRYQLPSGTNPRHLATHPFGKYLYSVMQGTNQLVSYILDPYMGVVVANDSKYSLIPQDQNLSNYWSSDVILSRSNKYLWASARGKKNTTFGGFISAFLLDDDGSIIKKMFTVPASTGGGEVNSISPAPWDDEWAVVTDATASSVQMWRMRGGHDTDNGVDYNTAEAIARVNIADSGCCSNAIWYN